MKTKLLAIILFSNLCFSQVGINTDNPNSTLSVNGSYSGSFRSISTNTTLTENDQFINVVTNSVITVTLPNTNVEPTIRGRIYTIKNTSNRNVIIRGFSNDERLRSEGGTSHISINLKPSTSIQIIRNQNINAANRWEIIQLSEINMDESINKLTFARSISTPINANTPTNSVVTIGNLRVRYNGTSPNVPGFIEYSTTRPSHTTIWYKKAGRGGTGFDIWSTQAAVTGRWYRMDNQGNEDRYNIHPANRDVSESVIILHNTRETYRVTSNLNGVIAANGTVPVIGSAAILFVEKLD